MGIGEVPKIDVAESRRLSSLESFSNYFSDYFIFLFGVLSNFVCVPWDEQPEWLSSIMDTIRSMAPDRKTIMTGRTEEDFPDDPAQADRLNRAGDVDEEAEGPP